MQYHIEFNICGAICLIVYFVYLRFASVSTTKRSLVFRHLVLSILSADVLDAVTAVTISYSNQIPLAVNWILNSMYYFSSGLCAYFFIVYMRFLIYGNNNHKHHDLFNDILISVWAVFCLTNPIHKLLFYFDADRVYLHGPLFGTLFGLPIYFIFYGVVQCLMFRKKMSKRQITAALMFMLCVLIGTLVQLFFLTDYLVIYFSLSMSVIIMIFALETPDYAKLLTAMDEMEQLTKEAEEAKNAADSANRAKSAFLASMSHEIRTPINGMLGMNAIAMDDEDNPEQLERMENIRRSGESLLGLVDSILDFTRIESGNLKIYPSEYELMKVLKGINGTITNRAAEKKLTFTLTNDPKLPKVLYGDKNLVRQIMMNLLNNAIKYTTKGGVGLRLDLEDGSQDGEMILVIAVSDTGIGISKEDQNSLFKAFERLDISKNRSVEGIGLGLTITRQLTELMGGTISFESDYGKGSVFTVRIPQRVVDPTPMGAFGEEGPVVSALPGVSNTFVAPDKSVLVVDDVPMNLKVVKGLLRDTKVNVVFANSGKECLSLAEQYKYDLILMDHMMPEMDGVETLNHLREQEEGINKDTPVVVLTANAVAGVRDEYLQYGFDEYLPKPVDKLTLVGTLRKFISAV